MMATLQLVVWPSMLRAASSWISDGEREDAQGRGTPVTAGETIGQLVACKAAMCACVSCGECSSIGIDAEE